MLAVAAAGALAVEPPEKVLAVALAVEPPEVPITLVRIPESRLERRRRQLANWRYHRLRKCTWR